jgi:hypothetical protein
MPGPRWRSKLMVRTSITVSFEPTGAANLQVDRPKSARSTNPQYQCGFRAIREETRDRSRDTFHGPRSSAYSAENTGISGERNPFREVPKVTPSALQSDFARNAAAMRWEEGSDVSRTKAHAEDAQKVTPWKNYVAEYKSLIGIIARHSVSPCKAILNPPRAASLPSTKRGFFRVRSLSTSSDATSLYEHCLSARIVTSAPLDGSASCPVAGFHLKIERPRRVRSALNWRRDVTQSPPRESHLSGNSFERVERPAREERPSCPSKSR